jgi:hypothetical protein
MILQNQLMFYGIRTTENWLINYAITHGDAFGIPAIDLEDKIFKLHYATRILQEQTGIDQLEFRSVDAARHKNTPAPDLEGNQKIGPFSKKKAGLTIVAVCSNLRTSFRKRPSQAKIDHLKEILGGEPKWWIDPQDR